MGVAGAGKTLIGKLLAERLGVQFFDGDDFHSPDTVAKMRSARPLDDKDRMPWLARIGGRIREVQSRGETAVFACSALKESYRDVLRRDAASAQLRFVYLRIGRELAALRLNSRQGHFMPAALIASQFENLEEPTDAATFDASRPPDELVSDIVRDLHLSVTSEH